LEEEKATLEGMFESRDELLMEIARETGLDCIGEDEDDEEEEEDANDGGDAAAPPCCCTTTSCTPTVTPEEIDEEGPMEVIPKQEASVPHEVILVDVEPNMSQLRLYHALMRDYEENPLRVEDDFDDLDDDLNGGHSNMDEWFPKDGSNDRDCVIKSKS
jgi:hypothetical protein